MQLKIGKQIEDFLSQYKLAKEKHFKAGLTFETKSEHTGSTSRLPRQQNPTIQSVQARRIKRYKVINKQMLESNQKWLKTSNKPIVRQPIE